MTELLTLPERLTTLHEIQIARKYLNDLRSSCDNCIFNFHWINAHDGEYIPFLDTDVIYASLPRLAAARAVSDAAHFEESSLFPEILGPSAVSSFLFANSGSYCLPFGTLAEMYSHHDGLKEELHVNARRSIDLLEERSGASKFLHDATRQRLPALLRESLLAFVARIEDISLLERIIKGSRPVEELTGGKPDALADEAFHEVFAALSAKRSGRSRANECDALNVASVVLAFNSRRRQVLRTTVPVLISTTRPLLEAASTVRSKLRRHDDANEQPHVIESRGFLLLSQAFIRVVGYDRPGVVVDLCRQLKGDVDSLLEHLNELFQHYSTKRSADAPQDGLAALPDQERLLRRRERFVERWGPLFVHNAVAYRDDKATMLNELKAMRITDLIERIGAVDERAANAAKQTVIDRLRNEQRNEQSFWSLLLRYSSFEDAPTRSAVSHVGRPAYKIMKVANDGSPLSQQKSDGAELLTGPANWQADTEARVVAFPPYPIGGAICAADIESHGGSAWLRLTWRHAEDYESVSQLLWSLCGFLLQDPQVERSAVLEWRLFNSGQIEQGSCRLDALKEILGLSRAVPTFVDVLAGDVTTFADVALSERFERQMGVFLPFLQWDKGTEEAVSMAMAGCSLRSVTVGTARTLIRSVVHGAEQVNQFCFDRSNRMN